MKMGWRQKSKFRFLHKCPMCGRLFRCDGYHRHIGYTRDGEIVKGERHKCHITEYYYCRCPDCKSSMECYVIYEDGVESEDT